MFAKKRKSHLIWGELVAFDFMVSTTRRSSLWPFISFINLSSTQALNYEIIIIITIRKKRKQFKIKS